MRVLYAGLGYSRSSWYRCVLPAMYSGQDWVGIVGQPPGLQMASGWVDQSTKFPNFLDYDAVVLQQVRGIRWMGLIHKLQERGIKVLYEIDDYVHAIRKADDHDFRAHYQKQHLQKMEVCMRTCDGVICSTDYLAERYERLSRRTWVCENGLDLGRYRLTRPPRGELGGRETVSVLWSGATGHQRAALPWLQSVAEVMLDTDHVSFVSVGQDFAAVLSGRFPERTISVPFTSLECYPAAMMMGDVSIAPAGKSDWYRAKSDLRVMESQALGIPVVADRHYRDSVLDGRTGIVADSSFSALKGLQTLVLNDELREKMSSQAREHAHREFDMQIRVRAWETAIAEAAELDPVREVRYSRES
jgi:glycosyltransferase involved in cell wall biosynthesis